VNIGHGVFRRKIGGAYCGLLRFRGRLERCWDAYRLRHMQRLRLNLIADQDQHAKERGPNNQKIRQNWHPHRLSPTGPSFPLSGVWTMVQLESVLQITSATARPSSMSGDGKVHFAGQMCTRERVVLRSFVVPPTSRDHGRGR
jgi:hypothetical protein